MSVEHEEEETPKLLKDEPIVMINVQNTEETIKKVKGIKNQNEASSDIKIEISLVLPMKNVPNEKGKKQMKK